MRRKQKPHKDKVNYSTSIIGKEFCTEHQVDWTILKLSNFKSTVERCWAKSKKISK